MTGKQNTQSQGQPLVWCGHDLCCKGTLSYGGKIYKIGDEVNLPADEVNRIDKRARKGLLPKAKAELKIEAFEMALEIIREDTKKKARK